MEDYFLIIDGSSLLSTQYYGNLPREVLMGRSHEEKESNYYKIMHTGSGVYTNGVYGFLRALFRIMENLTPKYIAVAWDLTRDTFRRELYADYKGNRSETPFPLKDQFALCQKVLSQIGIKQFMDLRYEADDFSGSLCRKFESEIPIRILTKDHDYLQLVDEKVQVFLLQNAQSKADELLKKYDISKDLVPEKCFLMNEKTVLGELGIKASSVAHLKGLQGDASDNIKGVPGIGEQTAVALISHFETIDALYQALNDTTHSSEELFSKMKEWGIKRNPIGTLMKTDSEALVGEKAARLSLQLATIKNDIPIEESLSDLQLQLNANAIEQVLHDLEFASLKAPNIGSLTEEGEELSFNVETIDTFDDCDALFGRIVKSKGLSFGVFADETLSNVYLAGVETVYHFVTDGFFLNSDYLADVFSKLLQSNHVYAFHVKSLLGLFPSLQENLFDVSVGDYLVHPLTSAHGPADLIHEYMKNTIYQDTPEYIAMLARSIGILVRKKLVADSLFEVYQKIEHPLIWVLRDMERTGIYADPAKLAELNRVFSDCCREEEAKVYEIAGMEFNLNSPKQLGEVLFDKLKIPGGKKTKSGYSTAVDVLEKLSDEYPIVRHILTYRQYAKLQSTYAVGLGNCIASDGRIHTTFQQTVTATGRLSSTEPNLQNIPIRTELGREIRKVFLPKEGCVFVDADYSQIELRLMAHMSGDEALIDAYNHAADIHRLTASQVFDVPFEQVTNEQRSAAKAVNFGILYGISSFGLGQNLGINRKTAEEYISAYYDRYPSIKKYLDNNVSYAKEHGFVTTLYGRIRPIPELESGNFMQRSFGERVAMNSPVQGTAADIMKLAMIQTYRMLQEKHCKAKMLVQVHDEILLEVPIEEKDKVCDIVKKAMEGAASLSVPLVAEVHVGNSWYEAK